MEHIAKKKKGLSSYTHFTIPEKSDDKGIDKTFLNIKFKNKSIFPSIGVDDPILFLDSSAKIYIIDSDSRRLTRRIDCISMAKTNHEYIRKINYSNNQRPPIIQYFVPPMSISNKIYELFSSGNYKYWSIAGIANLLQEEEDDVSRALLNDNRFRRSSFKTKDGRSTYCMAKLNRSIAERISELLAVANTMFNPTFEDDN